MILFDNAFEHVVGVEGGYSNNPADSGGPTKFGITERVARDFGYRGDMRDLPVEIAKRIYKDRYWDLLRLDAVANISVSTAEELFDTAVNLGVATAGKFLQRALNAFNHCGSDYADVVIDGLVGPATIEALRVYTSKWGKDAELIILRVLNGLQVAHYIDLVERRPKDEAFIRGWILKRVRM